MSLQDLFDDPNYINLLPDGLERSVEMINTSCHRYFSTEWTDCDTVMKIAKERILEDKEFCKELAGIEDVFTFTGRVVGYVQMVKGEIAAIEEMCMYKDQMLLNQLLSSSKE